MCSVAASMATSEFIRLRLMGGLLPMGVYDIKQFRMAEFDARVFQIPQKVEVLNYLIWRQQDAVRNSIASVAQSLYSPKELNGKNGNQQQEMIFQKGINWNDYNFREKRGGVITKVQEQMYLSNGEETFQRSKWQLVETPVFTQDREFLENLIPNNF
jgi:tRNA(His) 5'-end guanylyltransferase